jgi:hypothetical protein
MGSFSRVSGIVFARNSISPLLELHTDRVVVRVLRRRELSYGDIRSVALQSTIARPSVVLHFRDGSCFIARPLTDAWRIRLVRLLQARGVELDASAARYLADLAARAAAAPGGESTRG